MTREEAIQVLNTYDVNFYEYTAEEIADAIDMAISALQAEQKYVAYLVEETVNEPLDSGNWRVAISNKHKPAEPKFVHAVQGEWKIDEYGIYHCPFCHAINNTVYKSFCPNCGARMKGGAK